MTTLEVKTPEEVKKYTFDLSAWMTDLDTTISSVDSVTAELMVDNLLRLARRHLVVFVALRDPLLDRLADVVPKSLQDVHQAVVADSLARDREVVVQRLRRQGVLVVETVPRRLGTALLNRYLEIKRREMIS